MAQTDTLAIDQGATFYKGWLYTTSLTTLVPVNITGWSAKMQLRTSPTATTPILTLWDTANANPASPVGAGNITLGGIAGTVLVYLAAAETKLLSGGGTFDVDLIDGSGIVYRLVQGTFAVNPPTTVLP